MKTKLLSKILGVGLAIGLVLSLGAAFLPAGEAQADQMEWGAVNTPSWDDLVILPSSDILDYAVGGDEGDIIYAVLEVNGPCTEVGYMLWAEDEETPAAPEFLAVFQTFYGVEASDTDHPEIWAPWAVVMSDDGGVTWSDITENVVEASSLPFEPWEIASLNLVASAPDDDDWIAVAGYTTDLGSVVNGNANHFIGAEVVPFVVASEDGGDNFTYAHPVVDGAENMLTIADMAISPERDGIHNIALAGTATVGGVNVDDGVDYVPDDAGVSAGAIFRLEAGTWLTGGWEDTRCYDGWDGSEEDPCDFDTWSIHSTGIVAVDFSPNFDMDDTIVAMGVGGPVGDEIFYYHYPYLIEGTWDGGGAWNAEAGFASAPVQIADSGTDLLTFYARYMMDFALPADFDGQEGSDNNVYLYVNALHTASGEAGGFVFISEDGALTGRCGPSGDPLLASIAVHGDADTCKAMVGALGIDVDITFTGPLIENIVFDVSCIEACAGVAVYHTVELDDCCPEWEEACKDPSGPFMAVVTYTDDGEKEYATTTGSQTFLYDSFDAMGVLNEFLANNIWGFGDWEWDVPGNALDESAFSVSLDDAVSFNQIGLIDTDIDFLSDLAVCPDCSVLYLSTINSALEEIDPETSVLGLPCSPFYSGRYPCIIEDRDCCDTYDENGGWFACDSVWRSYDNGDTWERVYHGDWADHDITADPEIAPHILLRLPCDEDTECCTIYMGIQDTQDLFYSRDCGQCWNKAVNQKLTIQDFAVESENIVYILDENGQVSTSTQYGRRPSDGVDTGLDYGHSIVSCCAAGWVVVGGAGDEPVAWSEDGGETWDVTDDLPGDSDAQVHVACDPVCENIVYAALDGKGIFRTDLSEGAWDDMNAMEYDYTGIVVAREGTLYASSDQIYANTDCFCGEDPYCERYADLEYPAVAPYAQYSGVARNLTPCETDCCGTEDWDYLIAGMSPRMHPCDLCGEEPDSADYPEGTGDVDYIADHAAWVQCMEDCAGACYEGEDFDQNPSALRICGCLSPDTNSVLWAIDTYFYDVVGESCGLLWSYEDCAAKHGPELTSPEDGAIIACDVCDTCVGAAMTLEWERMCLACSYDIEIMDEDGNVIFDEIDIEITGDPPTYWLDNAGLECGRTYTWHVREANTETDECVHSPWSETWSFTIEASSANAVKLIAPEQGAVVAQRTGVGFSWSSVYDATTYSFVLSASPDLSGALASADVTGTAYAYSGTLDYETTYYWQVTAWKDGTMLSQSDVGTFAIAAEEIIPEPVQPTPPPEINIPPVQQITPTWIYAVIAIGAALIVVVIVLIVRSRRSS
ncbi:MAG: hypothetical protein PHY18_04560 [Dehalococcoidales bacterium]|nr:hypothetical protein [Dehalococcoidales bacterium]